MRIVVVGGGEGGEVRYCCSIINKAGIMLRWRSVELHKGNCWFTNRPKCEHTLEQSYSGMYSIFQQLRPLCTLSYLFFLLRPRDEQAVTLPFDKRKEEKLMIFFIPVPEAVEQKVCLIYGSVQP